MSEPFRILDLGAHDGFVTSFIARKAKEAGRIVHVDGIEANPKGVALFNERAERDDIPGECKQGLAEDAFDLFERYSYDAVVAFELLEHVPSPQAFLRTCEWMLKDKGRVYISTPNGTFGAGRNPHHLRVWNMVDLFDMLRRRGHVHDALPGPDGVSVVSYSPRRDIGRHIHEVAVYVGPGWETWNPNDIETKGLGGSETAAARLAEALSQFDCRVTLYGQVDPGAVGQVVYRPHTSFDPTERRDLVIVSRIPEVFDRRVNATRCLLWLHDTDCGPRLNEARLEQVDRVMCLSEWHRKHLLKTYSFMPSSMPYITRNGIEPSYFKRPEGLERHPHRAIYTSSPDRGLDILLELWPDVRERIPDAELHFAYASVYDAVAKKDKRIARFRDYIGSLSHQDGAVNLGSLSQPQVAEHMMQAGVWLAPSYSSPAGCKFNETFCIGAVESVAAGCRRVMSDWGALQERTEGFVNWLIPSDELGEPDREKFVDAIISAMESDLPYEASPAALELDWQEVAADMLAAAFQSESVATV